MFLEMMIVTLFTKYIYAIYKHIFVMSGFILSLLLCNLINILNHQTEIYHIKLKADQYFFGIYIYINNEIPEKQTVSVSEILSAIQRMFKIHKR